MENSYYPGLTSIRGIAALMVYLHHFNPFYKNQTILGLPVWGITKEFHIGVTIFFVLSGFLISMKYFEKQIDFKRFIWNRFTRIYPVYLLMTCLTFLFCVNQSGFTYDLLKVFFYNITFLRGFIDAMKFSLVAQGWSLTVEELFYFLAPIIFFLVLKFGKKILIILPFFLGIFGLLMGELSICMGWDFWGDSSFTFHYTFFGRSFEFLYGVLLAIMLKESNLEKLKNVCNPYLGLFLAVCSAYLLFVIGEVFDVEFGSMTHLGTFVNTVIIPIVVMTPLLYGCTINKHKFILLESKPLEIFGKFSFAFYLIHMGVIRTGLENMGLNSELKLFIALMVVSFMVWRYFEEPAQKLLKSLVSNNQ